MAKAPLVASCYKPFATCPIQSGLFEPVQSKSVKIKQPQQMMPTYSIGILWLTGSGIDFITIWKQHSNALVIKLVRAFVQHFFTTFLTSGSRKQYFRGNQSRYQFSISATPTFRQSRVNFNINTTTESLGTYETHAFIHTILIHQSDPKQPILLSSWSLALLNCTKQ